MSTTVFQETSNNFEHADQTINTRPILSAIYSPNEPSQTPSRVGEVHFQIMEGSGGRLKAWVAIADHSAGASWEALTVEEEEDPTVVTTNKANDFNDVNQTIGTNQIVTVIDGGSGGLPNDILPDFDGQIYFSYLKAGTPDAQGAAWMAKGKQWIPIAASGGEEVDLTNLAKLDEQNVFQVPQKIGSEVNMATFTSGRRTALDPLASSSPDYMPFSAGDVLVREHGALLDEHEVYVSTHANDADSWLKIYDSSLSVVDLQNEVTLIDGRVDTLAARLDTEEEDLDALGETVGAVDLKLTGIEGDISLIGTKVDLLEPRVLANESKIAALESHHDDHILTHTAIIEGHCQTSHRGFGQTTVTHTGNIDASMFASTPVCMWSPTASNNRATLPVIVAKDVTTLGDTEVRQGQVITLVNESADAMRVYGTTPTQVDFDGVTQSYRTIPAKTKWDILAVQYEGISKYVVIHSSTMVSHDIASINTTIAAMQTDIDDNTSRFGGVSGDVNILKGEMDSAEERITALEGIEHPDMSGIPTFPETLIGGRYLITNADGSAVECSTITTEDVNDLATFAEDVTTGDTLLSVKCLGSDTALTSKNISQVHFATGNVVIGIPTSGTNQTVNMADIVAYTSTEVAGHEVREGCVVTVCNLGAGTMVFTPPSDIKIKEGSSDSLGTYTLASRKSVTLFPAIYDSGVKKYIILTKSDN